MNQKKKLEEESKKLLLSDVSKRIKTTMIGSLDSVEKILSPFFTDPDFLERFKDLRKRILDLGNEQIIRVEKDLESYCVERTDFRPANLIKQEKK